MASGVQDLARGQGFDLGHAPAMVSRRSRGEVDAEQPAPMLRPASDVPVDGPEFDRWLAEASIALGGAIDVAQTLKSPRA